jgi:hypothetical protein
MENPMITRLAAVAAIIVLAGCAGRSPTPVAIVQPQDAYADCTALVTQAQANNQRMQELASEQGSKAAQNVAAGVAGLFIWPLWFAMDFQGSAGIEISALQGRQQYIATRATQLHCAGAPAVAKLQSRELSPNLGDGLRVQAAAVWD